MTEQPGTPPSAPGPPLPEALEERAYEVFLELPPAQRGAEFESLLRAHPEHAEALRRLCRKLAGAEAALTGLGLAEPATPERIGAYRLLSSLGEGGFGIVHLAEQVEPIRRQVALKLIRPGMDTAAVLRRFEAERELLARFDHPCIAKILDAGATPDGRPYLVTEYVPGQPITAFCGARALDLRARLRLFVRVCDGVHHAHQRGVIHRDLKPSNILVQDLEGEPWPKVIDFGIARALAADLATRETTRAGTLLGTPEYMSPEQAEGDLDVDLRTDVYALGVVLFELLVGELPHPRARWRSAGISELIALIRAAEAPRPSTRVQDPGTARRLRGDLDWIVLKALAKERERRYANVAALAEDVQGYLDDRPVTAGPPGLGYQVRKFVRRHRWPVGAAAVALLALLAGLVLSTTAWNRAHHAEVLARARLDEFLGLADVVSLRDLRARSATLWPATPERVPEYERWLAQAKELLDGAARRDALRATVAARVAGPGPGAGDAGADAERFLLESLAGLEKEIAALAGANGLVADVERRARWARSVRELTLERPAAAWQAACAAIAASPRYAGLRIAPVRGLVPLGADPHSGLHEFVVLQTGAAPERDAKGELRIGAEHGVVLVLIPGGLARIGAQQRDPGAPNYERTITPGQGEVHEVELRPFWIGKHEMSRAQWRRVFGTDPSHYPVGTQVGPVQITELHPVEALSWLDAAQAMHRLGLDLPTEAQWEHACRAGSGTAWSSGPDVASLQGHANLAGREAATLEQQGIPISRELQDAWFVTAPIGTFRPNAFGLHDLHGNLWEWCRDLSQGSAVPRSGDGLRGEPDPALLRLDPAGQGPLQDVNCVQRGGSYADAAVRARSSHRGAAPISVRNVLTGVRPALTRHLPV